MAEYSTTKLTPSSTTKFPANNGNTPGYVEGADLTTKAEFNDAINAISEQSIQSRIKIGKLGSQNVYKIYIISTSTTIALSSLGASRFLGISGTVVRTNNVVIPVNYANPDIANFGCCTYIHNEVLYLEVGPQINIAEVRVEITYSSNS